MIDKESTKKQCKYSRLLTKNTPAQILHQHDTMIVVFCSCKQWHDQYYNMIASLCCPKMVLSLTTVACTTQGVCCTITNDPSGMPHLPPNYYNVICPPKPHGYYCTLTLLSALLLLDVFQMMECLVALQ